MSKVVFVGNLPYDVGEEQIVDVLQTVGPVETFRLLIDKETGRSKGYGFCQFYNSEAASCAIRNLNGTVLFGRTIRIGHSDMTSVFSENRQGNVSILSSKKNSVLLNINTEVLTRDTVCTFLSTMSREKKIELLSSVREMFQRTSFEAKSFLKKNIPFCYVLMECLIQLDIVTEKELQNGCFDKTRKTKTDLTKKRTKDLLIKIMNMTDEEIGLLPSNQREEILYLKNKLQKK